MNCHSQIWSQQPDPRAGARELPRRHADALDPRARPARLRLLQPQHPREQGRRLHDLPRPRRPDAADAGRRTRCRWSGASTATATRSSYVRPRSEVFTMGYQPAGAAVGARPAAGEGVQHSEASRAARRATDDPLMSDTHTTSRRFAPARRHRGREYWRSLDELAETPEFQEFLHREFPQNASEWLDPVGRRGFLKLMGASLALAGVTACTRQPAEKIVPYVRQPEELVPGKPLFYATAMTARRRRASACWSRATKGGRPRSRATRSPGEPRRDRRLRAGGDSRPLRSRSLADADQPRRDPSVVAFLGDDARGARRRSSRCRAPASAS